MSDPAAAITLFLQDEAQTVLLGEDLALALTAGDCLALAGDLGAGKSTLARALIRALADDPQMEVPSPTFTLVQAYDLRIPVAHLDLYRLSDISELDELGLEEILADGVCLVEWPQIAGDALPAQSTIWLHLEHSGDGRAVTIEAPPRQRARLERVFAIRDFLSENGRAKARRRFFSGDASSRAYETISNDGEAPRILMDWPLAHRGPIIADGKTYAQIAHTAQGAAPFVAIANHLRAGGFTAPQIIAADIGRGLLLLEDLGREGIVDDAGAPMEECYRQSVACLAALHSKPAPGLLPVTAGQNYALAPFDRQAMKIETSLLVDWYLPHRRGAAVGDAERADYLAIWDGLIDRLEDCETALLLRDFHSPNILWQQAKSGIAQVGIIDFQDAMIGPTAYDLASLVQDARVTMPLQLQARLVMHYLEARQADPDFDGMSFLKAYAIMAAQRHCKLAGLWVRLMARDGKPDYMRHMPRTLAYLRAALEHSELAPLRDWCIKAGMDFDGV